MEIPARQGHSGSEKDQPMRRYELGARKELTKAQQVAVIMAALHLDLDIWTNWLGSTRAGYSVVPVPSTNLDPAAKTDMVVSVRHGNEIRTGKVVLLRSKKKNDFALQHGIEGPEKQYIRHVKWDSESHGESAVMLLTPADCGVKWVLLETSDERKDREMVRPGLFRVDAQTHPHWCPHARYDAHPRTHTNRGRRL